MKNEEVPKKYYYYYYYERKKGGERGREGVRRERVGKGEKKEN